MFQQTRTKFLLQGPALLNDGAGFFGAAQQGAAAVAGVSLADEAALLHQTVYVHRDEVCFQFAHLHHVAGGLVAGVVGEEHQDVKSRLGQMELLAQGLAEGGVSR